MTTIEKRKFVRSAAFDLLRAVAPNDRDAELSLSKLFIAFDHRKPNFDSTVNGLTGYIQWSKKNNEPSDRILETIRHDLTEFARNYNESWFCPRSYDYDRFIETEISVKIILTQDQIEKIKDIDWETIDQFALLNVLNIYDDLIDQGIIIDYEEHGGGIKLTSIGQQVLKAIKP